MPPCECKEKKVRVKRTKKRTKKLPSANRNFQPLPQYNIPPTINYTMPQQQPDNLLNFLNSAMSIFDINRLQKKEQNTFRNTANGNALPTKLYFDMATDTNDLLPKSFRDSSTGEDVTQQSLTDQVMLKVSEPDENYVPIIDDTLTDEPILDQSTERKKRKKPKEEILNAIKEVIPDEERLKQMILQFKKKESINKSFQNFNIQELMNFMSFITR